MRLLTALPKDKRKTKSLGIVELDGTLFFTNIKEFEKMKKVLEDG